MSLNNSSENSENQSTKDKILHVHNMLNIDKENFHHPIEKNVARSLRPALRTTNGNNQIMESTTTPLRKQIRFNLSRNSGVDTSENMTPTPPPKDFKRLGNRKTLRNTRCMSTIVTEKERLWLEDQQQQPVNSPKAPQGFVKSMCKFYVDNFSTNSKKLNRSNR